MSASSAALAEIAEINPRAPKGIASNTELASLPMAAVSSELAEVVPVETLFFEDVKTGLTYFEDGDILVAKITPCFENGKIALVRSNGLTGFGSTEFHVVRAGGKIDRRYLVHFLRQQSIRLAGEKRMTGSAGQKRVPKSFLEQLEIPLPPLKEQRRIAAILDAADALRAKRRAALAKLDTLAQSIFIEMFGDPVSNSKNWPIGSFGELGKLDRGVSKHRPRNDPALLGGEHPFIQTGDVANCDTFIRKHSATYSDLGLAQSKMWEPGVLCITIAANIAKTGILTFRACFPDSVVGFISGANVTTEYIQVWLSFLQKTLEKKAPESAQKNINLAILRGLPVPVPDYNLQKNFSEKMGAIERTRSQMKKEMVGDEILVTSLQHRAFRGELTASDLEEAVA